MPNTYSQIYLQIIFAPKRKHSLIQEEWENKLYKYINGIIKNENHKLIIINGTQDHVHIFLSMNPTQSVSELVQIVKANSSKWINKENLCPGRFEWQGGFGAFSYSKSQLDNVIEYIKNQKIHHRKKTFKEEYILFLKKFAVEYNEQYIFHDPL